MAEASSRDLLSDVILGVITTSALNLFFSLSGDLWALQNPSDKPLFILS